MHTTCLISGSSISRYIKHGEAHFYCNCFSSSSGMLSSFFCLHPPPSAYQWESGLVMWTDRWTAVVCLDTAGLHNMVSLVAGGSAKDVLLAASGLGESLTIAETNKEILLFLSATHCCILYAAVILQVPWPTFNNQWYTFWYVFPQYNTILLLHTDPPLRKSLFSFSCFFSLSHYFVIS